MAASTSERPAVIAVRQGAGFVLTGFTRAVPQAHLAARVLVPAVTDDDDVIVVLLDPHAPGVRLERAITTDRQIHPHLHLGGTVVDEADDPGGPGRRARRR